MPFLSGFTRYRVILASLKNKNILNGLKSGENMHCFFLSLGGKWNRQAAVAFAVCVCVCSVPTRVGRATL